jgi:PAS domain S-box-containing protein
MTVRRAGRGILPRRRFARWPGSCKSRLRMSMSDDSETLTNPNATGNRAAEMAGLPGAPGRESAEREAAWRRGEQMEQQQADGGTPLRDPYHGVGNAEIGQRAFANLAENVRGYAIFLMDRNGVITFWGEGARLIKWWKKEQAEGGHLRMLYPDGGSEDGTAEAHLEQAAESGEYTGVGHRTRSDGSTFWAGVTLTALWDTHDELLGFVKVTRDLTAQRATEAIQQAALEAAEEASRFKSQFLATVSHEVRTPLTSVMAYTDLMKMELAGPLTEGQHRYLDTMRTSSQHLLALLEDILDLSRAEAGHITVGRGSVSVGKVASQALLVVDPQARRRQVEVVNAISGYAAEYQCWGDEERVRQILLNLIGNAIKFTDPGDRVIVSAGAAADPPMDAELDSTEVAWVYFRIEDTGPGIPADRRTAIFEPFVQVDMSATRRHGGTGLGLAISRRLARLMGGDVVVRSEEGMGSTFFLWLPAAPQQSPRDSAADDPTTGSGAGALQDIREAVLSELEHILASYVARVRSDPGTRSARELPELDVEDHFASFLADVAQTAGSMGLPASVDPGSLGDGTLIQRTIAERHGSQRARLGWHESEVRREYAILREELAAAVRRRVRRPRQQEVEDGLSTLNRLLSAAEAVAVGSFRADTRS